MHRAQLCSFLSMAIFGLMMTGCTPNPIQPTDPGASGTGGLAVHFSSPGALAITLTVNRDQLAPGTLLTAQAMVSSAVEAYRWYLDGALLAGQTSAQLSLATGLSPGSHALMVVATKDGIDYSENYLFELN